MLSVSKGRELRNKETISLCLSVAEENGLRDSLVTI